MQSCLNSIDGTKFLDSETVAADIYLAKRVKFIIICSYLPPNLPLNLFEQNVNYLENICLHGNTIGISSVLLRDFNLLAID